MPTATLHPAQFIFEGLHYFRGGAENVLLGSFGQKGNVLVTPHLVVQDTVAGPFDARTLPAVAIDFTSDSTFDTTLSAKVTAAIGATPAEIAASANTKTAFSSTGHLRLVKIIVEANDMKRALIADAERLATFKACGPSARICNEIWVVMEATLADKLTSSGGLSLTPSMKTGAVDLTATASVAGSGGNSSTVTIPAETAFAYMLLKPSWNHADLALLDQDQFGIG